MDIKFGNVFCHKCDDYMYDKEFEEINNRHKIKSAEKTGTYIFKCLY